jgi:glycosylphosphatidylinositol transamidase (GPIT) subunit GPI8
MVLKVTVLVLQVMVMVAYGSQWALLTSTSQSLFCIRQIIGVVKYWSWDSCDNQIFT